MSILEKYGRDLTNDARNNLIGEVIGRHDEIRSITRSLSRLTKNNPILVGEPGVGKTAIIEGLAHKIINEEVPSNLIGTRLIEVDLPGIFAASQQRGEFEAKIKSLMKEIKSSKENIIIFIDEFHTLMMSESPVGGSIGAVQTLKPELARGSLKLIGATTVTEYKKYIEKDQALERRLQKIYVNEPSIDETISIMRKVKSKYEKHHKVIISDEAIRSAVKLSSRYIGGRFLPDKAFDVIDEASSIIQTQLNSKPLEIEKIEEQLLFDNIELESIKESTDKNSEKRMDILSTNIANNSKKLITLKSKWNTERNSNEEEADILIKISELKHRQKRYQNEGEYEKASKILYNEIPNFESKLEELQNSNSMINNVVTPKEVSQVISNISKIPVGRMDSDGKDKLKTLSAELNKRVKGQKNTVDLIVNVIKRSKTDINDPNRPLGSFLFLGTTGVGKTEMAKSLAELMFGSREKVIRIDMSEYQESHTISKLIGSPPGYVNSDEGGMLTEAVRNNPYSIVLLDEIEKGHANIFNLLLQMLDEGSLTDSMGNKINFKNTIIILTTNLGADYIMRERPEEAINTLVKHIKPEIVNRIDEKIVFNMLDRESIKTIIELELSKLKRRLGTQNILLTWDTDVEEFILDNSFDAKFGARPIKRCIQSRVENIIADAILENDKLSKINICIKENSVKLKIENV